MKMESQAQEWLEATVRKILDQHFVPETKRSGVQYELMSHLHSVGEKKAQESGHKEVTLGDLQAAVLDAGGENKLAQAFVLPFSQPPKRAGFAKRSAAFVVDVILLFVAWAAITSLVGVALSPFVPSDSSFWKGPTFFEYESNETFEGTLAQSSDGFDWSVGGSSWVSIVFGLALDLAYFSYFEASKGQTLGKKIFELRVLRTDGQRIGYREAVIRNLLKAFPVWTFPLIIIDALFIFYQGRKQRASDRIADTIVIEA